MNAPHLDDEFLSASLDGELAATDADHLAGCAVCAARRDGLAEARAALQTAPVEPVDELTRRRILTTALEGAGFDGRRQRTWSRRPALAGGVAAVLLAFLAAVPFLTGDDSSPEATTAALELAGGEFLGHLGDLSDPSVLSARLGGQESRARPEVAEADDAASGSVAADTAAPSSAAEAPPAAPALGGQGETSGRYSTTARSATDSTASGAGGDGGDGDGWAAADVCARRLAAGEAHGARLVAVATGTYRDARAVVAVFDEGDGRFAYVSSRDGCRLLTRYRV